MKEEKLRKLQVFGFDGLQNLVTLFKVLEKEGISIDEVTDYVKYTVETNRKRNEQFEKRAREMQVVWNKNSRRCPTCAKPLMARGITTKKGKQNLKGYTCHWFCQEEACNFEEYTHEDFKKVYQKIMQEGR